MPEWIERRWSAAGSRPSAPLPVGRLVALFVLLSAVPLALLAFLSVRLSSDAVREEVRARLRSNATLSAVAVHNELQGLTDIVVSYGRRPSLLRALSGPGPHAAATTFHLQELQAARPGIATAFLARPDGRLIDIVPATPSIIGKDFSFRDWYRGVTSRRDPYVSQAYHSQVTGHPFVVAAATLVRAPSGRGRLGPVRGILVAAYDLRTIERFTEHFASSQDIDLAVTDQRGVVVGSSGAARSLSSRRSDRLVSAALAGESLVASTEVSGRRVVAASVPVRGLGWTVTASVPERTAFAAVDRLRTTVISVAGVLGIVLMAGLTVLVATLRARRRAEQTAVRARLEAERANAAKNDFFSRMSHELRTPLSAVLGFGQLLEMETLTAKQKESVGYIVKAGNHLLGLINEVLDIARIEAGHLSLSVEPVAVADIVAEAVELVRPLAADHGVTLHNEIDMDDCHVQADRQRLKQVLLNLLSNGIKYNRNGGRVTVSLARPGAARARIEVADTGKGISAEALEQLFTPFQRLGAEQTQVEGTGLGLALSKGLVDAMQGELVAESRPGEGSTFAVELREVDSSIVDVERHPHPAPDQVPDVPAGTVLYIEDNLPNLKLVERVLAHRPGVRLLTAIQGGLGLELARDHKPDLILLDLHLPDMPGATALSLLRQEPATAEIPVVILSADATSGQIKRLRAQGANAYLTKPLVVAEFLDILDRHLQGAPVNA